jgi:predicted Zn-dependent protease
MLAGSFRLDTSRKLPRALRGKPTLLLAALILAGCGGSSEPKAQSQVVRGHGFSFSAPAGWRIQHSTQGSAASRGSELVQVSTFPLARLYTASLFTRVAHELGLRMKTIAQETGGKVTDMKTVTAGGVKSHRFDVTVDGHIDQYTFVLIRKREYQLLCRVKTSSSSAFCSDLLTSFRPA